MRWYRYALRVVPDDQPLVDQSVVAVGTGRDDLGHQDHVGGVDVLGQVGRLDVDREAVVVDVRLPLAVVGGLQGVGALLAQEVDVDRAVAVVVVDLR